MADEVGNSSAGSSPPASSPLPWCDIKEIVLSALATGAVMTLCLTGHITGHEALAAIATGLALPADPAGAARRLLGKAGK